jgi:hypothetical protein
LQFLPKRLKLRRNFYLASLFFLLSNGVLMEKYTERFFAAPTDSFFIFGPRGTGKSTWLKKTFPNAYFVDLSPEGTSVTGQYPQFDRGI